MLLETHRAGLQPPLPVIELQYGSAALIGRDRLPQLSRGLLARTRVPVRSGDEVEVVIEAKAERITIRAHGRVGWATSLHASMVVGLSLEGRTAADRELLEQVLRAPSTVAGAMTPALTPAAVGAPVAVLAATMLEPNPVLRQILATALGRLATDLHDHGGLKLDACAKPECFMMSLSMRRRQLAVLDQDAVPRCGGALVDAIRSHEEYARLPLLLLSGSRAPELGDPFTATLRKPLSVKSFLSTAGRLLRA